VGDDAVWIQTLGETIATGITWRLDPETGSLVRFAEGEVNLVAAAGRDVWLDSYEDIDTIVEVDADTRSVLATIRVPRLSSGTASTVYSATTSGVDREAVWITYQDAASLVRRLDPSTGAVVAEVDVGPVEMILANDREVWVATNDGSVVRIDPSTNRVADRIEVTRSPKLLALGNGSLWVADARDPVIAQADPETGDVVTIGVGGTPLSMAFGEGGLWVIVRPS
jgi:streptogramin lyase